MINSHERYLTLARFSLSFNDPPIIIIMRFATLFAFMLSLAALAAATSYPRPFDSTFTDAIDRFITASVDANSSISIIYDDFGASQGSQERALYDDVRVVSSVCQIALRAVASIYTTVQSNNTILETEYVGGLCVYTMVKNELTRRFCSL